MRIFLFLIATTLLFAHPSDAQGIFGKIKKATQNKINKEVNRAENKVVDNISSRAANAAVKPLHTAVDETFKDDYKTKYGKDYDDSQYDGDPQKQAEYRNSIIQSMYGSAELPDQYVFTYVIKIKVNDYGEKKGNDMYMLINPEAKIFGIKSTEEGSAAQTMVFDIVEDQVAIFNDDDMSVLAMPNVTKMAQSFGRQGYVDDEVDGNRKFEKINKRKKVIRYQSQGYNYETEIETGEFYVTDELPFNWNETFGHLAKKLSPNFYKENPEYDISGMMMYGKSKRKSDGDESKWEVTEVTKKYYIIECSDYELPNGMGGN